MACERASEGTTGTMLESLSCAADAPSCDQKNRKSSHAPVRIVESSICSCQSRCPRLVGLSLQTLSPLPSLSVGFSCPHVQTHQPAPTSERAAHLPPPPPAKWGVIRYLLVGPPCPYNPAHESDRAGPLAHPKGASSRPPLTSGPASRVCGKAPTRRGGYQDLVRGIRRWCDTLDLVQRHLVRGVGGEPNRVTPGHRAQ